MIRKTPLLFLATLLLSACGHYGAGEESAGGGTGNSGGGGTAATKNCDELFTQRVQPRLDFCRNCHVPHGVADTTDGHLFMLSSNRAEDFVNLQASWTALGGNNPTSRILLMPSGQDPRSHTGGTQWPAD